LAHHSRDPAWGACTDRSKSIYSSGVGLEAGYLYQAVPTAETFGPVWDSAAACTEDVFELCRKEAGDKGGETGMIGIFGVLNGQLYLHKNRAISE